VAPVDQQAEPAQGGATFEICPDQGRPDTNLLAADRGIAIARQIDQHQAPTQIEEIDLLGAAGRVGHTRQCFPAGQRIDQARLAHIGTPGEATSGSPRRRQGFGLGGTGNEIASLGEQKSAGLDSAGRLRPAQGFRLIRHIRNFCWEIDSRLFQAQ